MKISKSELKLIVKECLIELLAEGLSTSPSRMVEKFDRQQPTQKKVKQQDDGGSAHLMNVVAAAAGNDKLMSSIFASTAQTTLLEQNRHEVPNQSGSPVDAQPRPVGAIEMMVDSKLPDELFGTHASENWAKLAFAPGPKGSIPNSD